MDESICAQFEDEYLVTQTLQRAAGRLFIACRAALPAIRWGMTHHPGNMAELLEVERFLTEALAMARGSI